MASFLARAIAEKAKRDDGLYPAALLSSILDQLITAYQSGAIADGTCTAITATTSNGKSVSLQVTQTPDKMIELYQEAYDLLTGAKVSTTYASFR